MIGRICAGLFALTIIGFYVFSFVFPEQLDLWVNAPGLLMHLLGSVVGMLVFTAAFAALFLLGLFVAPFFGKEGFPKGALGSVYLVSFGFAWIILSLSPLLSLSWSWSSAFDVFIVGGLLSPGVIAMLYVLWPRAFFIKHDTAIS